MANVIEVLIKAKDQVSGELEKASNSVKGFNKNLLGIGVAAGAMSAGIVMSMKKVVDAAAQQEMAEATLAAAMKQAGTFTQEALEHNLAYARSLQQMTTYGDETIIGVQKMLTNFGVEGEMLDKLTAATLDLAAAKGMDLRSAADLVAKTVGSSTNALTRYGITVEGAAGSTERAQMAVENISTIFGGSAAAMADTYAGRVAQMSNAWGDLKEKIGMAVLPALTSIAKAITDTINKISDFMDKHESLGKIIMYVAGAIAGGAGLLAALAAIVSIAPYVGAAFTLMTGPIGWVIAGIAAAIIIGLKFRHEIGMAFAKAADTVLMAIEKMVSGISWLLNKMGIHWLDGAVSAIQGLRAEIQGWGADLEVAKAAAQEAARASETIGKAIPGLGGVAGAPGAMPTGPMGLRGPLGRTEHTPVDMILGVTPEQQEVTITKWDELITKIYEISQGNFESLASGLGNIFDNIAGGFGNAMASMAVMGRSFADSFRNTFKSLIASLMGELMSLIAKLIFAATLKAFLFGGAVPTIGAIGAGIGGGGFSVPTSLTPSFKGGMPSLGSGMNVIIQTLDASSLREELRHGELGRELRLALGGA